MTILIPDKETGSSMPRESTEDLDTESRRASAEIIIMAQRRGYIDENLLWIYDRENLPKTDKGTVRGFQSDLVRSADDIDEEILFWRKNFEGEWKSLLARFRDSTQPSRPRARRVRKSAARINPDARAALNDLPRQCWAVYARLAEIAESKGKQVIEVGGGFSLEEDTGITRENITRAVNQLEDSKLIACKKVNPRKWDITLYG